MNKDLITLIYSDLKRHGMGVGLRNFLNRLYYSPGFRYMWILRNANYYRKRNIFLYLFYKTLLTRHSYKYGFQIPYETQIGKGFYIGHFGRIIINPAAKIGENVNISPGVTIGMTNRGKKRGVPIVGDEVWIGTNAILVGNIKIGNNVLIAPNAYVNFDVPENSIVIGNPARIIHNEKATDGYIDFKCE
jgi:serine O-acetyltransferase